ncbi:MAG: transcriptional regulator [Planctomycetota bacterium]
MTDGDYSYEGLDRLLHERARLSILTALSSEAAGRSFPELRSLCGLTDGNLSRHLKVLEEAKLLTAKRTGRGRGSNTHLTLSSHGRRVFTNYLTELERVLRDARAIRETVGGADLPSTA